MKPDIKIKMIENTAANIINYWGSLLIKRSPEIPPPLTIKNGYGTTIHKVMFKIPTAKVRLK